MDNSPEFVDKPAAVFKALKKAQVAWLNSGGYQQGHLRNLPCISKWFAGARHQATPVNGARHNRAIRNRPLRVRPWP
jgi:hypothetical protein